MQNNILLNNKLITLLFTMLGLSLMLIMAPKASATIYDITETSACTLNDAFEAINTLTPVGSCDAGEATSNTINLAAGTYNLTADLEITNGASLTMTGAGMGQTIIDGGSTSGYIIGISSNSGTSNYNFNDFSIINSAMFLQTLADATVTSNVSNIDITACKITCLLFQGGDDSGETDSDLTINILKTTVRNTTCGFEEDSFPCVYIASLSGANTTVNILSSSFYNITSPNYSVIFNASDMGGILTANFTNNTIYNNEAAALWLYGTSNNTVSLINNTISGNKGGIIAPNDPAPKSVTEPTALEVANSGLLKGLTKEPIRALENPYAGVTYNLTNNIFNNTDGNCPTSGPTINSSGGNISSDGSCSSSFDGQNDKNDTNPLLQPLTNVFPYVMPITQESPAFGNGVTTNAPTTDQRGEPRNQGRIDSGAYQLLSATPTPNNNATLASTGNDARIPALVAALMLILGLSGFVVASRRRLN